MACNIFSCGSVETPIWNVTRENTTENFIHVKDLFGDRFSVAD
jgi:hypothetical protein